MSHKQKMVRLWGENAVLAARADLHVAADYCTKKAEWWQNTSTAERNLARYIAARKVEGEYGHDYITAHETWPRNP